MQKIYLFTVRVCLMAMVASVPAFAQVARTSAQRQDTERQGNVTSGTVVSHSSRTMVVRTEEGEYVLFTINRDTAQSGTIGSGARVRVTWGSESDDTRDARSIEVAGAAPSDAPEANEEPVPPEVRKLERQIERQARRYRAGARVGVGLDPEIVSGGLHATLGPFFRQGVWFRPNIEAGFGEVTTLFALNLEAIYRLPFTPTTGRWSAYLGAGPGLNFIDRDFEAAERGEREIDFDDFDYETSLNILAGVEFRSGMFMEVKATAYSRPNVKMLVGYSF